MLMMDEQTRKPLVARYQLRAKGFLNSISNRRVFDGALIQVGGGYGCIHPWPELGDPPLEKCLEDLAGPRMRQIVRRALRCAEMDAAARENEESLFEEMEVPLSHATLVEGTASEVERAVEAGFEVVKLKLGRDVAKEAGFLMEMAAAWPKLRWRLDFNEAPDPGEAGRFLAGLSPVLRMAVDFVEDPCPYSEGVWSALFKQHRVKLAVDREAGPDSPGAQVLVVKPAVDEPFPLAEGALRNMQRVVLTSYMDHPLGQAFAAWEAARLEVQFPGLAGVCGLQTHHLFEADGFSEQLGPWSPSFTVPAGTGLGFDDELEALPWTRLY